MQKYGSSTYSIIAKDVEKCGDFKNLKEKEHIWRKKKAGRAQRDRYFPVPNQ